MTSICRSYISAHKRRHLKLSAIYTHTDKHIYATQLWFVSVYTHVVHLLQAISVRFNKKVCDLLPCLVRANKHQSKTSLHVWCTPTVCPFRSPSSLYEYRHKLLRDTSTRHLSEVGRRSSLTQSPNHWPISSKIWRQKIKNLPAGWPPWYISGNLSVAHYPIILLPHCPGSGSISFDD